MKGITLTTNRLLLAHSFPSLQIRANDTSPQQRLEAIPLKNRGLEGEENMDDFSFPTVPVAQEPLCQVPFPLWFVSSIADQKSVHHRRRSFSSAEEAAQIAAALEMASPALSEGGRCRFLDDEERMDMLWEDFNEELRRMPWDHKREAINGEVRSDSSRHGRVDRRSVRSRAPSKTASIIHHRRPSLLLMLKVLKKLFLIQKTSSSKRKPLH